MWPRAPRRCGSSGCAASRKQAWRISFPPNHPKQRATYRAIYLGNDPAAYAELPLVLARLEMTASDWGAIRAPTLVASGAHDFLWPPEISRQVANLIPDAKYVTMEDAGHFPICRRPRH
jgi:pimeloyl-ACP methyl ester carboxylesterase